MTDVQTIAPVRHEVVVPLEPTAAFDLFTRRIDAFWPRAHHIGSAEMAEAVLEARPGGRWYERGVDGSECDWGRVLTWEPPGRLVLNWQIDAAWRFDPDLVTEVDIRFEPAAGGGTRVTLEHHHLERLGASAVETAASINSAGGWPGILELYRGLAA